MTLSAAMAFVTVSCGIFTSFIESSVMPPTKTKTKRAKIILYINDMASVHVVKFQGIL